MESLGTLLEFGVDVAWRAGRATLAHFQTGIAAETKADLSPVTLADREAERIARDIIESRFPEDGILGEEHGVTRAGARRRWIIDPIDGTRSFIHGVPLYGVLLALEQDGDAVIGVIHFPALDETVYAARGEGCWWNGRRAHVSDLADLAQALVLTTEEPVPPVTDSGPVSLRRGERAGVRGDLASGWASGWARGWNRLRARAGLTRTWGDCYGYALVATGRAEAMLDPVLSIWDAAAIAPVIAEAGGALTDWHGRTGYQHGTLVATNAALAQEIRNMLVTEAQSPKGTGPEE